MYKELLKLSNQKKKKKRTKNLSRHFSKEAIHEEKPMSLTIRIMQIKSTMRYNFTAIRMTINNNNNKSGGKKTFWQGCAEIRTLLHCWWECK